nr:MAG TPA: hypothetical protein [Bacteriophage sp.]
MFSDRYPIFLGLNRHPQHTFRCYLHKKIAPLNRYFVYYLYDKTNELKP